MPVLTTTGNELGGGAAFGSWNAGGRLLSKKSQLIRLTWYWPLSVAWCHELKPWPVAEPVEPLRVGLGASS